MCYLFRVYIRSRAEAYSHKKRDLYSYLLTLDKIGYRPNQWQKQRLTPVNQSMNRLGKSKVKQNDAEKSARLFSCQKETGRQ